LTDFVCQTNAWLPKPKDSWRLTKEPIIGQINGIPTYRGAAVATNGIMVVLVNEASLVFIGHLDWFIPDDDEVDVQDWIEHNRPKKTTSLDAFNAFFQ
jgi:hypothetical protein